MDLEAKLINMPSYEYLCRSILDLDLDLEQQKSLIYSRSKIVLRRLSSINLDLDFLGLYHTLICIDLDRSIWSTDHSDNTLLAGEFI